MTNEFEYSDYADPREVERVIHAIERRGRVEKDQKRIGWALISVGLAFGIGLIKVAAQATWADLLISGLAAGFMAMLFRGGMRGRR